MNWRIGALMQPLRVDQQPVTVVMTQPGKVMADQYQRPPFALPTLDVPPEQTQANIVQRRFGLVEQQHLGIGQAQSCQQGALQLAAGQRMQPLGLQIKQSPIRQRLPQPCPALFASEPATPETGAHQFGKSDRKLPIHMLLLRQIGDTAQQRYAQIYASRQRAIQTGDYLEQAALARSVAANDSGQAARSQLQIHWRR